MENLYNIDPETCTKEELEKAIDLCEIEENKKNSAQLGTKVFLNSIYGAIGAAFFNLHNVSVAESVTSQGQDLVKFAARRCDEYFRNEWVTDYEAHERAIKEMQKKYPDFDGEKFKQLVAKIPLSFNTLQAYGDSVAGSSMLCVKRDENVETVSIEDLYNSEVGRLTESKEKSYVSSKCEVLSGCGEFLPIKYVMRHYTQKSVYRVTSESGKFVDVTEDHSVMVYKSGGVDLVEVKPTDIHNNDRLLVFVDCECREESITSVEKLCDEYNDYVYDIEVDTDDPNNHTFYANQILVHNTDSVAADSVVRTADHPDGIEISKFYEENLSNPGDSTAAGHESVNTDDNVCNIVNGECVYTPVKRIIRHNVSKPKWKLKTASGKEIICTQDHSLVVYRNGVQIVIKPSDVIAGDQVACFVNISKVCCEDIVSCECIGTFEKETVYDIETADDTHTFVANDILVHNSAYVTLQPLIDAYQIPHEQETDFDLAIYNGAMAPMLDAAFEKYAQDFNCDKNLEVFELEKISRTIIMLAKKNYMCDVAWVDSGAFLHPLSHITYTGYDVVKGSTPDYCRQEMKNFVNFCMEHLNRGVKPTQGEIVTKLREIKQRFMMQHPEEIAKSTSISNYENFVLNDKTDEIVFADRKADGSKLPCPIHVRAAAVYNNILYTKGKKYMSKYQFLHSGDKVKWYYTGEDTVAGFVPNHYPNEIAKYMPMDMNIQFEKMLLSPLNRIVVALGYQEIPASLTFSKSLF